MVVIAWREYGGMVRSVQSLINRVEEGRFCCVVVFLCVRIISGSPLGPHDPHVRARLEVFLAGDAWDLLLAMRGEERNHDFLSFLLSLS